MISVKNHNKILEHSLKRWPCPGETCASALLVRKPRLYGHRSHYILKPQPL